MKILQNKLENTQLPRHRNMQLSIKCRRNNAWGKMDIMINSSYFSKFLQKEETIKLK